ncbi:MAG: carbohydrate binding domain-containing protein [Planctomycetota bacterium]
MRNGGFEEDADSDGLADHWQFAGDKEVVANWGRDAGHEGRFSQRLTCTDFTSRSPASHAMLCQLDTLNLEKGRWYKISFAAKQQGIPARAVQVAISNTKSWTNCGLQESFRASSDWRRFEFTFRATETVLDRVRLQFWYNSTGSLWLDDVALEPSEPVTRRFLDVVALPTGTPYGASVSVNLLPNSSFECGLSGWGSIAELPGWGGNLNLPVGCVDGADGKFHSSSFKIALAPETIPIFYFDYFPLYRVPVTAPLLANRGWLSVEKGMPYTLSAYIKAESEGLVGLLLINQADRRNLRREVQIRTQWDRYVFTFEPQAEQIFVALGLDLKASKRDAGTVWIDGIQLERGPGPTAYRPRTEVEVGLETGRVGNLFPYGEEPKMKAMLFNAGQTPQRVVLNAQITDFDDAVVHRAGIPIELEAGRKVTVPISSGVQSKGFYRLKLECAGASAAFTRPMRFAIIEPYTESDSLFGMNHAYPWPHLLDLSSQMGLCWFRDWSLKWHDVEPEKGHFEFAESDRQIDRVLDRGLNVLALLPFPSSNWSSSAAAEVKATTHYPENRERVAYMPRNLNDLAGYVRQTVGHYRDRVNVWEILNEPIFTSYALPRGKGYRAKDYVQLLRVAYQAVKAVDAQAFVIGGIAGGPATYTQEFIDAGGLHWVDALNLHIYPGLASPEAYEEPLSLLRGKMRSDGMDKPIWFTEGAYYADDDKPFEPYDSTWLTLLESEAEAAEWQTKFNTLLLAYGAEKIIYHSGTPGALNNESLSGIFFEWAGAPRKMLVAQAAMANLLSPPVKSLGPVKSPEMTNAYGFETRGRTIIIAWRNEEAPAQEISLAGKPWRAVDMLGNELRAGSAVLTGRPLYLVSEGTEPAEMPW